MSNYQEIDSLEDKLTEMIRGRATYRERLGEIERDENLSSTGRHTEAVELCEKAKAKHEELKASVRSGGGGNAAGLAQGRIRSQIRRVR